MNVGVYLEPRAGGLGGAEAMAAVLAAGLADRHAVTLIHHRPGLTADHLADYFDTPLPGVDLRYEPPPGSWLPEHTALWNLPAALRDWKADYSRGFDLFVALVHGVPPVCQARRGALVVLFPLLDTRTRWPFKPGWTGVLRRPLHRRLWRERMNSYAVKLSISRFTAGWTERFWGVPTEVVYPPVPDQFRPGAKRNAVVSLGRFCPMKKQKELAAAFAGSGLAARGWTLTLLGSLAPEEHGYFAEVEAAAGPGVVLKPNAQRDEVHDALGSAKVFWHAAGLGEDADREPWRQEHFGIATAEAMAAGCVPVVADRGGQPELVEDGVSGFVCDSLPAFVAATRRLADDDRLRVRMAAAAVRSADRFTREAFVGRLLRALAPVLPAAEHVPAAVGFPGR